MPSTKTSTRALTLMATLAVLVLLLMTDLSPRQALTFEDLPYDGKSVQVPCIVIGSREANGGAILELEDQDGSVIEAYCPEESMVNMTLPCSALVTGRMDDGDEPFMFVDKVVPLS
ncbi:MAG: hypothetical protein LLG16_05330 [Euryarchaeota archaeon]|nr:hypothetical protein [Euryarchaeota archaeon]